MYRKVSLILVWMQSTHSYTRPSLVRRLDKGTYYVNGNN